MSSILDEKTLAELDPVVAKHLRENGLQVMGIEASFTWWDDPKRMAFSLARYKFVSKILEGCESVFEAGCADGFALSYRVANGKKLGRNRYRRSTY